MICYLDMTFCSSPACRNKCGRQLTEQVRADAVRWWGGPDPPIASASYCDERGEVIERGGTKS